MKLLKNKVPFNVRFFRLTLSVIYQKYKNNISKRLHHQLECLLVSDYARIKCNKWVQTELPTNIDNFYFWTILNSVIFLVYWTSFTHQNIFFLSDYLIQYLISEPFINDIKHPLRLIIIPFMLYIPKTRHVFFCSYSLSVVIYSFVY